MPKRFTHTRDFLVPCTVVDRLNELPAQWLARALVAKLEKTGGATDLEVGGMADTDCAAATIHSTEPTEELIGIVHFVGLLADDQSFCRFVIVDHTPDSKLIAAARHMVTLGETLHCEAEISVPVAA